jgi:hypothetical protein
VTDLATSPAAVEQAASETIPWGIDFTHSLASGETVNGFAAPTAAIYDLSNRTTDVSATKLSGSVSVSGTTVLQAVTALVSGHRYRLDVTIRPTSNKVLTASLLIVCVQ